ncbi:MAG: deaminase [Minisyncoccia bacterium]
MDQTEGEKWMNEAANSAKKSLCHRAKCGSVIVKDGAVIGRGYNAPPLDVEENRTCTAVHSFEFKPKSDRTCCMHAEWRAIIDALKSNPTQLAKSTLYFARVDAGGNIAKVGKPYCTVCSRMALDVGIGEFVLWHDEGITAYDTHEYDKLSYANLGSKI